MSPHLLQPPRRHLGRNVLTLATALFLVTPACSDDPAADAGPDAGPDAAPDAAPIPPDATTGPDAETLADAEPPPDAGPGDAGTYSTLALTRAFTTDGRHLVLELSAAPSPGSVQEASFRVELEDGTPAGVDVTAADLAGTATVTLDLASALPRGATYRVSGEGLLGVDGLPISPANATTPILTTLHLALIWHQHQPLYVEPNGDYLRGPWVRKHAVKDYYDMTALVGAYPDIHVMVNLTPVLLYQLESYYLTRLAPFVDTVTNTIDTAGYLAQRPAGTTTPVTDPWVDMLLEPTPAPGALTEEQRGWFYEDIWSSFSISDVMIARFPAYEALRRKRDTAPQTFTQAELLAMKGWFQLAWFDPDFLRGPVTLPTGDVVDLSDLVTEDSSGSFTLTTPFTEATCQRLVVEEYKVLAAVIAVHRDLMYDPTTRTGQVEVMTTPFFHPILPLLHDSDLAKIAQPTDVMPSARFQQTEDARAQIAKAKRLFAEQLDGRSPTGMWPAEGSVAEAVVPLFQEAGLRWIATDRRVLERSTPPNQPIYSPYRLDSDTVPGDGGETTDELAIVFRDTELSDKLGFHYQGSTPDLNVADFMASLRKHQPRWGVDGLLTVILDGENAWEHYRFDNDAKGLLNGIYRELTAAQGRGEYRTVTVSEYLDGNPARGVLAHPVHELPELEPLWAGSWISASYSTWIGEEEENLAWDYLAGVRADLAALEAQGLTRPDPLAGPPPAGTPEYYEYRAWESMYAAEGSDWFWWYGTDQTAFGGDEPFDRLFIELLKDVYRNAQLAGYLVEVPDLAPILRVCVPPAGPMTGAPTIDGAFTPDDGHDPEVPNEWTIAGAGVCMDVDTGVEANPDDVLATYHHGLSADSVLLGLRMRDDLRARVGSDYQLRLYFSHKHIVSLVPETVEQDPFLAQTRLGDPLNFRAGGAAREVIVDLSHAVATASVAEVAGSAWGVPVAAPEIEVAAGIDVVELRVPYSTLHFTAGDPLELLVALTLAGRALDAAPNTGSIVLALDRTALVEVTFVLDCTGARLPLTAVKPIDNPPPPAGTGSAFIVGNKDALGQWSPNTVPMADDGVTHGDQQAGDNFWTFQLLIAPLEDVQYKYTIGSAGEGWGPTEEYPLTNRGFVVRDLDGDRRMVLRDVFADRPDPSGTLPGRTEITNP